MFDRFTDKSIKAIMWAQEESRGLGHNYVGTEQLLLGVIDEGTSLAAETLVSMGFDKATARQTVFDLIGYGPGVVSAELPFTTRAATVLDLAVESARKLNHSYVDPTHIIIAILKKGSGRAFELLGGFGINTMELRDQLILGLGKSYTGIFPQTAAKQEPSHKYSQAERRQFMKDFLIEIGNVMRYSLNMSDAIFMVVNITGKVMMANRCLAIIGSEPNWRIYEFWDKARVQSCHDIRWPTLDSPLVTQVLLADSPISIVDKGNENDESPIQKELRIIGAKSILAVTLRSDQTVHGCLLLHQCDEWRDWTEEESDYLEQVAAKIAEALARIR